MQCRDRVEFEMLGGLSWITFTHSLLVPYFLAVEQETWGSSWTRRWIFWSIIDVMVGKAFAMLGFIRRLSFEFRDPSTLRSLYKSLVCLKLWYGSHYMTCVWTRLNVCREGLSDMLCVVWAGRISTICHRMSIGVLFCALTRLWKGALSPA
jgi:hypothetical protein